MSVLSMGSGGKGSPGSKGLCWQLLPEVSAIQRWCLLAKRQAVVAQKHCLEKMLAGVLKLEGPVPQCSFGLLVLLCFRSFQSPEGWDQ